MEKIEKIKENKETAPKKVFIELGTHDYPVSWAGTKKFGENEIYVGVDIDAEALKEDKRRTMRDDEENGNIHFIHANARNLPLADRIADEVFLGNVLGAPYVTDLNKDKFIEEAKRILKPGGRIIIKETNTPTDLRYLDTLIRRHELAVEKGATPKSPEWAELIEPYDKAETKSKWSEPYIVFLKPVEK